MSKAHYKSKKALMKHSFKAGDRVRIKYNKTWLGVVDERLTDGTLKGLIPITWVSWPKDDPPPFPKCAEPFDNVMHHENISRCIYDKLADMLNE